MFDWFFDNPWALWLALAIILGILEILMLDFIFLMMALAALITAGSSFALDSLFGQAVLFAVVCLILLLALRPPLIRKFHQSSPDIAMNSQGLIGSQATVTEEVSQNTGLASIAGDIWTSRTQDPTISLPAGSKAKVLAIKGATAYLGPVDSATNPSQAS